MDARLRVGSGSLGPVEQAVEIRANGTGRNQTIVRQGRVAPADVGVIAEDVAKAEALRQSFEAAAWVGDGGEVSSGLFWPEGVRCTVVEVLEQGQRLYGTAGLGGWKK